MWDNLNTDFQNKLRALVAESGGRITLVSGYRSQQRQADLFAKAITKYGSEAAARKYVAPPGSSNHEKGVAMDLGGDIGLAHQLAPKYGLTFPMSYEPWHVEPEGLRSDPAAYTTPPEGDDTGDSTTDTPDHVDTMMKNFQGIFTGTTDTSAQGAASTDSVAQASTEAAGAGTTPAATTNPDGSDMSGSTATATGTGDIDKFLKAIGNQESGGNYDVTNSDSGAHGKYQIMPANWSGWAREAGLAPDAQQTPDNQEKVARFKVQQYYNQFKDWHKVAKAWYGGPGAVDQNVNAGGGYPSTDRYADQVVQRMGSD